ncbi:MarR family winged helix-turn-helix transcriptional regulator [Pseudarthrobacter sp. P1]|uniref:MarR family winged helix-turn-helix transcriptional regulator n=1 Tax=Pseudarthrobacter sp. P1 TaxID=3418418 RepID=UPI003CF77E7B
MNPAPAPDQLGFLLARHGRTMNAALRQALGAAGLNPRHASTLVRLHHAGATSQQDLLDILSIDASALVAILNDLERDGLAERRRDPADRRRHIVEITTAGRTAVEAVEGSIAAVEREAFAGFSPDELGALHALLSRIHTGPQDLDCATD